MTARREVEIRVHIPDGKGELVDILALLAEHHLATLTRSCSADQEGLLLLLTTSRPEDVQAVLKAAGYRCEVHPVLLVGPTSSRPGAAARLLTELDKQGVGIRYLYLSSIDPDQCFVVVETTDDEWTLKVVTAEGL